MSNVPECAVKRNPWTVDGRGCRSHRPWPLVNRCIVQYRDVQLKLRPRYALVDEVGKGRGRNNFNFDFCTNSKNPFLFSVWIKRRRGKRIIKRGRRFSFFHLFQIGSNCISKCGVTIIIEKKGNRWLWRFKCNFRDSSPLFDDIQYPSAISKFQFAKRVHCIRRVYNFYSR